MLHAALAAMLLAAADVPPDEAPIACGNCATWNREQAPFRVFGNTYYVGMHGLSSVLIVTKAGLILIDGDLPQSAEAIAAHIKALGFDVHDVRWILASHVHFDHVGGIAALQRMSGANVGASELAAEPLRLGQVPADDPQYDGGKATGFPAVPHVEAIPEGGSITLGDTRVFAHYTPGHTPGGTTWSWSSCEKMHCVDVVYADSLSSVVSGNFRYGDAARHPTTAQVLRRSIVVVRRLPCDILLSTHPDASDTLDKAVANAKDPKTNAFIDRKACTAYANDYDRMLDERLKKEAAPTAAR